MLMHPSVVKRVEKASTPAKNSKNILTNEGNNSNKSETIDHQRRRIILSWVSNFSHFGSKKSYNI
jgi:hypothetical protein